MHSIGLSEEAPAPRVNVVLPIKKPSRVAQLATSELPKFFKKIGSGFFKPFQPSEEQPLQTQPETPAANSERCMAHDKPKQGILHQRFASNPEQKPEINEKRHSLSIREKRNSSVIENFEGTSEVKEISLNGPENELSNNSEQCRICEADQGDRIFMPCGHGIVCESCSTQIVNKFSVCPFCREVKMQ